MTIGKLVEKLTALGWKPENIVQAARSRSGPSRLNLELSEQGENQIKG